MTGEECLGRNVQRGMSGYSASVSFRSPHASKRMGHQSPCPRGRSSACPSRYVVTSLFRHETRPGRRRLSSVHRYTRRHCHCHRRCHLPAVYASNKVGDKMNSVYEVDDGRDRRSAARLPTRGVTEQVDNFLISIALECAEANLGMFSMFGRTAAPTRRGPHKSTRNFFSFFATW